MSDIKRVWKEYSISTECQSITIQSNESYDGMILRIKESENNDVIRTYLSYEEALELGKLLRQFANESKVK